jgi:hypothetical protein
VSAEIRLSAKGAYLPRLLSVALLDILHCSGVFEGVGLEEFVIGDPLPAHRTADPPSPRRGELDAADTVWIL